MRPIKFRAKDFATGEWRYGSLDVQGNGWYEIISHENNEYSQGAVVPKTIGQFTGLKDKNGKKIYEGDIVEFDNLPNMFIRFDNGSFMLCEDEDSTYEELRMNYTVEVIGNIHDNPELLTSE